MNFNSVQTKIKENPVAFGIGIFVVALVLYLFFSTKSGYSLSDGNTSISPQLLKALQNEGYAPPNEELQQKQNTLAPANQVPPPEDIMDVSDDVPPETPLEPQPNLKTAQAVVLNPNTIALPNQAPVEWQNLAAIDLKKCKVNRNGNGSIFHINCVNRDTGKSSELCGDIPFDPKTMSEPPLRGPNNDRTKMEVYLKSGKCDAKWDINNVVDKGCIPGKLGRQVEIQCRLPSTQDGKFGIGVHGCPNLKRQPINGMDMMTTPIQAVNRDSSWSSAILNDQGCSPKWDFAKRVDKGCQAQAPGKVFHIPCSIANGSLSVGCKNLERQPIDGNDMLLNPVRNPEGNNAYTQVVISDDACKLKWDFGNMKKLQCRKDKPGMVYQSSCVRSDGSKSLGCNDIMQEMEINGRKQLVKATRSVDDAAVSRIVLDEESCAPQWNWGKRQKNGCVKGGIRSWTIPCTNGLGQPSAGCLDKIDKDIFRHRIKQDGLDFVDAKRRNLKEMDVFTKDKACESRWVDAEKRATVGCKYGGKPYTLPCRNFEGKFDDKCPNMVKTSSMIHDPKRLTPYRSEIYLKDKECEIETKYFIDTAPNTRRDPRWKIPKKVQKDYRDLRLQQFKQKMASRSIS